MSDRWYFAYGSNLAVDQKEDRTGKIREARRARLAGYRVVFNKLGKDKTGKANLEPDGGRVVWGVVYLCNPAALKEMDKSEGVACGHYHRAEVEVECDSGEMLEAVTYIAGESYVRSSLTPAPEYLERIIRGACDHGLPEEYIQEVQRAAQGDG